MGRKARASEEHQHQEQQPQEQPSGGGGSEDVGAAEVQERVAEAQEQGFFGQKVDPYDDDEYTATGNQGRKAAEDRAKAVNPEGHGHAIPGRGL